MRSPGDSLMVLVFLGVRFDIPDNCFKGNYRSIVFSIRLWTVFIEGLRSTDLSWPADRRKATVTEKYLREFNKRLNLSTLFCRRAFKIANRVVEYGAGIFFYHTPSRRWNCFKGRRNRKN